MKKIFIIFPEEAFLHFFKSYFEEYDFEVDTAINGVTALGKMVKMKPDLILVYKDIPNFDLLGFIIKKRITPAIKNTELFLIGDFNTNEIFELKKNNVKAFISYPINLTALKERILIFFNKKQFSDDDKTPMLMDIHTKEGIIIIQIEANFEPEKLILMNYKIRSFCNEKKIKYPRILLIFPSLYPDTLNHQNLDILFDFCNYKELIIKPNNVKILTKKKELVELLESSSKYGNFEIVANYYDGLQGLNIDFNKKKTVPVSHLKVGSTCIFDLYDEEGDIRIPALSTITTEIKEYLEQTEKNLTYYSDKDIDELMDQSQQNNSIQEGLLKQTDKIITDTEEITIDTKHIDVLNEKVELFFRKIKGHNILIISRDTYKNEVIKNALDIYLNITFFDFNQNVANMLKEKKFILIFLDQNLPEQSSLNLLKQIRQNATRRQITVIILTKKINKLELNQYKNAGTDYILLTPFSNKKILYKVFQSIYLDRQT